MTVLSIILGILMIILGGLCLATPLATSFAVMYFYMILLFVIGIYFLVTCIMYRRFGVDFVFAILSLIAGAFIVFSPYATFVTETILLYIMAAWLIIRGAIGISNAFRARPVTGNGLFACALIFSILVIIAGIYSFIHPMVFAGFLGILAACYFIVEGFDLIFAGFLFKDIKDEVERIDAENNSNNE